MVMIAWGQSKEAQHLNKAGREWKKKKHTSSRIGNNNNNKQGEVENNTRKERNIGERKKKTKHMILSYKIASLLWTSRELVK